MKYITPEGKEAQGDAAVYLDAVGAVDGDTVKGAALEVPQREIVNTITDAGLTPDEADLHQLSKAVDAKIASKLTVATETAPGIIKPDGITTVVNPAGVLSAVQHPTSIATSSTAGIVKPDSTTITVDDAGTISAVIPAPVVATTATAGVVKVDGSTISITDGVISATKEPIATTSTPGLVKPDGTTIIAGADGTLVATAPVIDVATTSKTGTVKPDGTSITITGDGTISAPQQEIPVASTTVSGTVKVDGSTVTIADGVISATAATVNKATSSTLGVVKPDNTTITIDANGTLTSVAQELAKGYKGFSSSKTADQVIPDGLTGSARHVKITFNQTEWNTEGHYDTTTSKFTPAAGKWLISASIQMFPLVTSNIYQIELYKNGVQYKSSVSQSTISTNALAVDLVSVVDANGTDYFEIYVFSSLSNTYTVQATTGTFFQAAPVQAATVGGTTDIATASTAGIVKPDGTTITVDSNGVLKATAQPVSLATSTTPGTVQPDNSTITINGSGIISAALPNKATNSTLGVVKPDGVSTIITADGSIKSVFGGNGGDPNCPPNKIHITTSGTWVPPHNGWAKISLRAPGGGGCGGSGRTTQAFGGGGGGQGELVEIYQYLNKTDVILIDTGIPGTGSNSTMSSTSDIVATWPEGTDATNATITINGTTTTAIGGKGAGKLIDSTMSAAGKGGGTSTYKGADGTFGGVATVAVGTSGVANGGNGGGDNTGYTKIDGASKIQIDATGYGSGGAGGRGTTYAANNPTRGSNGGPGICIIEYLAINASSSVTGFGVTKSTAQVIPENTSANVKVTFDTVESNYKNQYDLTTNKFTPSPGRWIVNIGLELFPLTESCDYYAMLYKNGTQFKYAITQTKMSTNMATVNLSTIIDANGTDYFEVYVAGTDVNGAYSTATYSVKNNVGTFFNAIQIQSPAGGSIATSDTPGVVKPDGVSTVVTADGTLKSVFSSAGGDPNVVPSKTYITTSGTWVPPHNGWAKISLRAPGGGGCGGNGRLTAAFGGAGGGQGELIEIYQYLNKTDVINIDLGIPGIGSNAAIGTTDSAPTVTAATDATNATITINGTTTTAIGGKGATSNGRPGLGGGSGIGRGESGMCGSTNNVNTSIAAVAIGGRGGGTDTGYGTYNTQTSSYVQLDAVGYGSGGCGGYGATTSGTATATKGSNGGPGVCVVEYLAINGNAYKGFSAGKSVAQSIPGNTASYTKLVFDTIDWNPGSVYDPATGKFTPPPGKWSISASIQISGLTASSIYQLRLYKNGVVHRTAVQQTAITSNILIVPMSTVIDANGTDYFELYIYSNATAAYSVTVSTGTYFQAVPVQSTSLSATEAMVTAAQAASVSAVAAAETVSHLTMPSGRSISISLPATGGTFNAPSDGYVVFVGTGATAAGQHAALSANGVSVQGMAVQVSNSISIFLPVKKDATVTVTYSIAGTKTLTFVYAEGAF